MKLLGIVTAYYPQLDELESNICSYLNGVDKLIIWENTPEKDSHIHQLYNRLANNKIEIRTTGKNEYLAKPFNECVKWAESERYTHILTMDQDSSFEEGHFEKYKKLTLNYTESTIAIFAPNVNSQYKSDKAIDVESVITSGSIHEIHIFKEVNYYREDLKIHMGDVEFCIKVRDIDKRILCFPEIILKHQLGYRCRNKFGFTLNPYSAQSTYYIVRNNLILWKEYPTHFSKETRYNFIKYKIIYRTLKMIFESDTRKKYKAVFWGLAHGITGKTGEYTI